MSASPSPWLSVPSSTAHDCDGARLARTLDAASVPVRMPEPRRNSRRVSGKSDLRTGPGSEHAPDSGAAPTIGITFTDFSLGNRAPVCCGAFDFSIAPGPERVVIEGYDVGVPRTVATIS